MIRSRRRIILGLSAAGLIAAGGAGAGIALAATSATAIQVASFVLVTPNFTDSFTSCTGLGSASDIVSSTSTLGTPQFTPGPNHYDKIVCNRPMSTDFTLEKWRATVINGALTAKVNATLVTLDQTGNRSATWSLAGVWPSQLHDVPPAEGSSLMEETVTLVVDKQTRLNP